LYAQRVQWGDPIKLEITKKQIDTIIKDYVDKNENKKVNSYHADLESEKNTKISKYDEVIFVNDNLMWQDDKNVVEKELNILESKIYCRKLRLANRKDWRVPKYNELLSIIDYNNMNSAIVNESKFNLSKRYWSISFNVNDKNRYLYVDFKDGETGLDKKSNRYNIRCVRSISKEKGNY